MYSKNIIKMIKIFFIFILFVQTLKADQLLDLEAERLRIENQKTLTYSKINTIQSNIQSLSEGLAARKDKLSKRLQSAQVVKNYKWGAALELKNLTLLHRNLQALKKLNQYDLNFIREQAYKIDELNTEKENLIRVSKDFDHLSKKLKLQEELITKQESIDNQVLTKNATPSLLLLKGQLALPIYSEVKESYGLVKNDNDSQMQYIMYNKGTRFKFDVKDSVQAVGPGKVIFRDVLNHWGESIILEHDGGYYSVYANVKDCVVQIEQKVQMAEKICNSTSDDLYFELRHSKITINPKNWIKEL